MAEQQPTSEVTTEQPAAQEQMKYAEGAAAAEEEDKPASQKSGGKNRSWIKRRLEEKTFCRCHWFGWFMCCCPCCQLGNPVEITWDQYKPVCCTISVCCCLGDD